METIFNTSASTSIEFRIGCVINQMFSNIEGMHNVAIKQITTDIAYQLQTKNKNLQSLNGQGDTYYEYAEKIYSWIIKKVTFLNQLLEVVKATSHDYPILNYTISILSGYNYILGIDLLVDPED